MQTVMTKGIARKMEERKFFNFVMESLERFQNKDWGNTTGEDAELNNEEPDEALASYEFNGTEIWIKADGPELITVLLPDEY